MLQSHIFTITTLSHYTISLGNSRNHIISFIKPPLIAKDKGTILKTIFPTHPGHPFLWERGLVKMGSPSLLIKRITLYTTATIWFVLNWPVCWRNSTKWWSILEVLVQLQGVLICCHGSLYLSCFANMSIVIYTHPPDKEVNMWTKDCVITLTICSKFLAEKCCTLCWLGLFECLSLLSNVCKISWRASSHRSYSHGTLMDCHSR